MSESGQGPAVMVFARQPVPGSVKTRLIPALGEKGACQLHLAMLRQVLQQVLGLHEVRGQLWLAGDSGAADPGLGQGLALHRQLGANLGERMGYGFRSNFAEGYGPVLVCGADCPALSTGHFRQMLAHLRNHDAVLVPALDGGYVALGLRRFDKSLMRDIPWGQATVYQRTLQALEKLAWSWIAMEPLPDIDRAEDLHHLQGTSLRAFMEIAN